MDLYIHIGTNKTGSSYLQTLLTINQDLLKNQGVWVPCSKWDEDMISGRITPGNGHELALKLLFNEKIKVSNFLKREYELAKSSGCSKVVISNEVIVRLFSNQLIMTSLEQSAKKVGFVNIKCLCILRNAFDHALSLYKHRAKSGNHYDYEKWLKTDYETLWTFKSFLRFYKQSSIEWTFKLYKNDSKYIEDVIFKDFLDCNISPQLPKNKKVNSSLNLKHIQVLQTQEKSRNGISKYLYHHLLKLEQKESESQYLLNRFNKVYQRYVSVHSDVILRMAKLLTVEEQELFLKNPEIRNDIEYDITNSEKIKKAIEDSILECNNNQFTDVLRKIKLGINLFLQKKKVKRAKMYGGSIRLN